MTQRPLVRFDLLPFLWAAMDRLDFSRAPAHTQQLRSFAAVEPASSRRALRRQDYAHRPAVIPFLGMVVNGSAQIFKIASRTANAAAVLHVGAARFASDLC